MYYSILYYLLYYIYEVYMMKNRFILIFTIITVLIASLVPVSVYGYSYNNFLTSWLPYEGVSNNTADETDYTFIWYGDYATPYGNLYADSSYSTGSKDVYSFLYGSALDGYYLCIAVEGSLSSSEKYVVRFGRNYNTGVGYTLSTNNDTYNALTNISYSSYDSYKIYGAPYKPSYSSLNEGLDALKSAIDNGSVGGVTPKLANITIQPGTVAFVSVTGGNFTLKTTFGTKFSGGLLSSARYWYATSLPSGNFTVGNGNNIQPVIWSADEPFDMSHRTYNGIMEVSNLSSGYYAIYNPIEGVSGNNGVIRATFSNAVSVTQYPLNNSYDGSVLIGTGSEDNVYVADNSNIDNQGNVEYVHYDLDENGNVTTSSAISLPVGGNNIIDESDSSLSGLVDRILYLLAAPVRHIQQLFDSGNAFMQWLGSLWSWLPEPVYVILTSALVVLMVIGVIKFLWK